MGEAFITRRGGGGGAMSKCTDITDSLVWDSSDYGRPSGGFDSSKIYVAFRAHYSSETDEYGGTDCAVIINNAVVFEGGNGGGNIVSSSELAFIDPDTESSSGDLFVLQIE